LELREPIVPLCLGFDRPPPTALSAVCAHLDIVEDGLSTEDLRGGGSGGRDEELLVGFLEGRYVSEGAQGGMEHKRGEGGREGEESEGEYEENELMKDTRAAEG
jgi:hypothetical protein